MQTSKSGSTGDSKRQAAEPGETTVNDELLQDPEGGHKHSTERGVGINNAALLQVMSMSINRGHGAGSSGGGPGPPDVIQSLRMNGNAHTLGPPVGEDSQGALESQQSNVQRLLEDIEGNAWLKLYRRLYLRSCDAYFGPIFVAMYSALLWSGVIPLWVALWIIPLTFFLGVKYIIIHAAGMPVQLLPYSRLPAGMVAALQIVVQTAFMVKILPFLPDKRSQCILEVVLATLAFFLHYRSFATDPGYLEPGPPPPPMLPDQLAAMQAAAPYHCFTCGIYRPIRSKHCSACGRCVSEMDHHCPVVANCIGCGNRREFAGYLLSLFSAELLWLKLCWDYWHRKLIETTPETIISLANTDPGMAYLSLIVIPITLGTGYLTFRQIYCIVANLTTNEYIKRHKYEYLKGDDGTFLNPFDNGILNNCTQFWESKRPDWYDLYSKKRQLGPDGGVVPCSMTALVRKYDAIHLAINDAWQRRQRQREEWLIRHYGQAARTNDV